MRAIIITDILQQRQIRKKFPEEDFSFFSLSFEIIPIVGSSMVTDSVPDAEVNPMGTGAYTEPLTTGGQAEGSG